jgi:hypothetical protein
MAANEPLSDRCYETAHLLLEHPKSMAVIQLDETNRSLCIDSAQPGEPACRTVLPVPFGADVDLWPCVVGGETVAATILPWP